MNTTNQPTKYKGFTIIEWNFTIAITCFVLTVTILLSWQTPASCYQLTSVLGAVFLCNGLLGTTKLSTTRIWPFSSYLIGMLLILFAAPSFIRQLAFGPRGALVGFTYYSNCAVMLLFVLIGVFYIYLNWHEQMHKSN